MMDTIIELRMTDSQLNDCPLTLRELELIKGDVQAGTGMISVLQGIYHVRIPYPNTDPDAKAAAEDEKLEDLAQEKLFEGTPTE